MPRRKRTGIGPGGEVCLLTFLFIGLFRLGLPAHTVDATPSNQLIRQYFPWRTDLFGCTRSKPSQCTVPTDLTSRAILALVFSARWVRAGCCVDPLRPPGLPDIEESGRFHLYGKCVKQDLYRSLSAVGLPSKREVYFETGFSAASFWAVARASAAGTFTSGSTPVPSQLVLLIGLMARAKGTPIMKWSSMR